MKIEIFSISGKLIYSGNKNSLRGANLRGADLRGKDLRWADLREADLRKANLHNADLCGAILSGAKLRGADLSEANLRWADLREADLRGTNLRDANICEADLRGAKLRGADLRKANFLVADLREANLHNADFAFSTGLYIPGIARSMQLGYSIVLIGDTLIIGSSECRLHEWFSFSDDTIYALVEREWWKENRLMIYVWSGAADFGIEPPQDLGGVA